MKKLILLSIFLITAVAEAEIENVFSTPGFLGQNDYSVENKILELTRLAVPGSTIRAALYSVNRVALANELVAAARRGVDVRLVLDGGNAANINTQGHAINILVNELQCAPGAQCMHFCQGPLQAPLRFLKVGKDYPLGGSCRGLAINHNKMFLFSQLSDGRNAVVAQTSANMNQSQLAMYQDMLIIANDQLLFFELSNYWMKLLQDKTALLKKSFANVESVLNPVKVYFFPRLTGADPVLELLKRVNCKIPGSSIRAAHAAFTRVKVAEQMRKLRDEGCTLQVIVRDDPKQHSPGKKVRKALGQSLVVLPFAGETLEMQSVNSIHTKIILINASIDNSLEKIPVVMTGSHNLDLFSLRTNDEILFEVRDPATYERYDNFLSRILFDAGAADVRL